jgi:5'-nucleotidase
MRHLRTAPALLLAAALFTLAGCASRPPEPVRVKVLAINDFHGHLKAPGGGIRIADPSDRSKTLTVAAGGAEHLATAVAELRAQNPNHVFVAAGDLIGATPLLSALFRDEPTIESLGLMGLEASAVGNHEFDHGAAELLRLQAGGCHIDGCKGPAPFAGARFQYLAASTVDEKTGRTLLPAYHVKRFQGVPVAFIGLTLKDTPNIVMPSGVAGLRFADEAETVNALVPQLQAQGIRAIVLLIHEGGFPAGDYNECPGLSGPIVGIVERLDPAVRVVISGHTHRAYNCRIGGRLVTSGDKHGTVLTQIDLTLDPVRGTIVDAVADNVIVRPEVYAKDPQQTALIAAYEQLAGPLGRRAVGRLTAALPRDENAAGESPLGQVVADAQLAATAGAGAQIALMNPGGIRTALVPAPDGQVPPAGAPVPPAGGQAPPTAGLVRYEDLFAAQPFSNNLVTITLSGRQLAQLLEQQWAGQPRPRVLQVSRGFAYTWDAARPTGQRVVADSLRLNGQPIGADTALRITVNSYLAAGGDNFSVLKAGTGAVTGMMDVDALELHLQRNNPLAPPAEVRIRRLN